MRLEKVVGSQSGLVLTLAAKSLLLCASVSLKKCELLGCLEKSDLKVVICKSVSVIWHPRCTSLRKLI